MEEQILARMNQLLQLPIGTLSGTEMLDDLENWDSMSAIELMTLADEEFSIKLDPSEINDAETVNDLICLLLQKEPA